jgi:hypothetical protein
MAIVSTLDFENSDIDALCTAESWTKLGTPVLSTDQKHRGRKSMYVNSAAIQANGIYKTFWSQSMYSRLWLYVVSTSGDNILEGGGGMGDAYRITLNASRTLSFVTVNTLRATTTTAATLGRWYEVFFRLSFSGVSAVCELKAFGETLTDTTAFDDMVYSFRWATWYGGGAQYYIDNLEMNDSEYPPSLASIPTDQQYSYPTVTTISSAWTANSGIVTYSDNFNRADGNLVSPWTGVTGGQLVIASGVVWNHTHPANGLDIMYYDASDIGVNQFSECTIMLSGGSYRDSSPAVRVTPASGFYDCNIAGGTAIIRRRFDDTILVTVNAPEPTSTDIVRLEATGTNPTYLRLYKNSILIASATDSSAPITSGKPGLQAYSGSAVLDNWHGGTVPAATLIGESIPTVSGYVDYMDFEEATISGVCVNHGFTKGFSQEDPTTSKKYRGNQSLKLSYLGNINKAYTNPYPPKTFFRLMFNVESYPTYWDRAIVFGRTTQGWEFSATLLTDGRICFESPGNPMGTAVLIYTPTTVTLNEWHEMFMRVSPEDGVCECIIDGIRMTNNDAHVVAANQEVMEFQLGNGDGTNNNAGVVYIDEFEQNSLQYPGYGAIQSSSPPRDDIYEAKLGSMVDPGVHTDHFLEYTYRKPANADRIDLYAGLYSASGVIYQTLTSGITTGYVDGILAIPNDRAALINDYSDLRVRFIGHSAMPSGLLWRQGFEVLNDSYAYSTPVAGISGLVINTDAFVGDRCWKAFSPTNQNNIDAQLRMPNPYWGGSDRPRAYVTCWMKIADTLSYMRGIISGDYAGYDCSAMVPAGARTVRLYAGYTLRATTTSLVPLNEWFRLDLKIDHSNATVACADELRFNGETLQYVGTIASASNLQYVGLTSDTGNAGTAVTYFDNVYVYSGGYY